MGIVTIISIIASVATILLIFFKIKKLRIFPYKFFYAYLL